MGFRTLATLIIVLVAGAAAVGQRYQKLSPFDGVMWKDNRPQVRVDETWYDLVSIEGHSVDEILAFCRKTYKKRAGERFVEDLVEVLATMGTKVGSTVQLRLVDLESKKLVTIDKAEMSREKRNAIRGTGDDWPGEDGSGPGRKIHGGDGFAAFSPFDGLRWKGDKPEVKYGRTWYDLVSVNDRSLEDVLAFCRATYPASIVKKRFGEDLVEILTRMGHRDFDTAKLVLRPLDGTKIVTIPDAEMSSEKRASINDAANDGRSQRSSPSRSPRSLGRQDAVDDLEHLGRVVERYYSYRDLHGVDVKALVAKAKKGLSERPTVAELGVAVMKVLAPFGDGHTRLRRSSLVLPAGFLPFSIVPHGDRWVALRGDGSGFLSDANPYITAIDDVDIDAWLGAVAPIVPPGTEGFVKQGLARRLQAIQFARAERGVEASPTLRVTLSDEQGKVGPELDLEVAARPVPGFRRPGFDARILDGEIGYLRIGSMDSGDRFRAALARAMGEFRPARGLVIDVRDNGGGSREALLTLLPYFMAPGSDPVVVNVGAYRLRENDGAADSDGYLGNRFLYPAEWSGWSVAERSAIGRVAKRFEPDWTLPKGEFSDWHYMLVSLERNPAPFHFDRPVVVLADEGCFSATDIFLGGFQGMPGTTIAGATSGGGSGRSRPFGLPSSGLEVRLSSMASFRANGSRYDGVGVAPDVAMAPILSDLVGETDTVLDRALQLILKK